MGRVVVVRPEEFLGWAEHTKLVRCTLSICIYLFAKFICACALLPLHNNYHTVPTLRTFCFSLFGQAYKDSKVCNVLMMREMDKRFSADGMVVSALFPGCIAESPLFREKRGWFRAGFPVFQKFVTKQFVSTSVRFLLICVYCGKT